MWPASIKKMWNVARRAKKLPTPGLRGQCMTVGLNHKLKKIDNKGSQMQQTKKKKNI
jgi:hypothetical protein